MNKNKKNTENKHKHESEVARLITKFEETPGFQEDRNMNKNKHKIRLEAEKTMKSKNKPEPNVEAVKEPIRSKKMNISTLDTPTKMTSPDEEKIKTAANKIGKFKSDSPKLSTKMKPQNRVESAKLLNLLNLTDNILQ